jgi:acyl-homoserine-lactone acylase
VRWTSYGVAHVQADGLGDLGFGQGWAAAKQHLCRLADQFVRVRAQRARWFGPGDGDANLDSDFFHLHVGYEARARDLIAEQSDEAHAIAAGWVAGYNHYVTHASRADWPADCRDAEWVEPIDELDLARLGVSLATLASSQAFLTAIARAAPDGPGAALPTPPAGASNAWALGAERTEEGGGMLVANPHFPWEGNLTFTEVHLTVAGELDVYGATIPGIPMVAIGFTRRHAWSHTFSSSSRFLIYRLPLADTKLTPRTYTIDVRKPDGGVEPVSRTLYRSRQGPIIVTPQLPWSTAGGVAFALHDAALDSAGSAIDLYLGMARARSLDDFRASLRHRATPFLNTIYADVEGNAWYVDGSAVADLGNDALAALELSPALDGGDPRNDTAGIVPIEVAPELWRRDYVMNANDSYAHTHPEVVLDGHSPLYGSATAPPSPRTLMNLRMLREKGVAAASGADGLWRPVVHR